MNYVEGKVVVITGSGSGFGQMTAVKAAKMGAKVVVVDIVEERIQETLDMIKEFDGDAVGKLCDVGSSDQVKELVDFTVDTYGSLDVYVSNAGIMPLAPFHMHDKALPAWDKCIDINLKGNVYAISHCYDQMIKQGRGHIVFVASTYAFHPMYNGAVYQATKIGVRYLAQTLKLEARGKIKSSIVNPSGGAATKLGQTVVGRDDNSIVMFGGRANYEEYYGYSQAVKDGTADPALGDVENIKNMMISVEDIADSIIFTIDQPWGRNIREITVGASNEPFLL